jgi:hypothetical protein
MKAYTFAGTEGGKILTSRMGTSWGNGPWFELYDPTGNRMLHVTCTSFGCNNAQRDTIPLPISGVYTFLAMDDDGNQTGSFNFTVVLQPRSWAGTIDSAWNRDSNWVPARVPTQEDSVVIPLSFRPPVAFAPSAITVSSLNIAPSALLTVTPAVPRFTVLNYMSLSGEMRLAKEDTLTIQKGDPAAFTGTGKAPQGTITRSIQPNVLGRYRFESESTYVQFKRPGVFPSAISISTFPNLFPSNFGNRFEEIPRAAIDPVTNTIRSDSLRFRPDRRWVIIRPPPTGLDPLTDTLAVRRAYALSAQVPDTNFYLTLALRYEQSEVPAGVDESRLKMYWADIILSTREYTGHVEKYSLDQNYPNPFNPTTTIRYALPAQSTVSLKVYNILGQEVKALVNENQVPGGYAVQWNGTNNHGLQVSTGIYFYRLEVNGIGASKDRFTQVKKMLLIK